MGGIPGTPRVVQSDSYVGQAVQSQVAFKIPPQVSYARATLDKGSGSERERGYCQAKLNSCVKGMGLPWREEGPERTAHE